jgi:hypothetical protein
MLKRVFVTGVYSSGKTHFAKELSAKLQAKYICYDDEFNYENPNNHSRRFLDTLPSEFVIDAIPIDENHSWDDFIEYEAAHSVEVVCIYCPSKKIWLQRVCDKRTDDILGKRWAVIRLMRLFFIYSVRIWSQVSGWPGGFLKRVWGFARTWLSRARNIKDVIAEVDELPHLKSYRLFFQMTLPCLDQFKNVRYFDSQECIFTSKDEMLERIGYRFFALEDHLDSAGEDYDSRYQDIEIIDFIGYSESHRTWKRIQDLVDWEDKRVIDLGCFHGYFSFKVEDLGGTVHGLDKSSTVLDTARMINDHRGGNVVFSEWEGGEAIPDSEIILCLNVLHHFDNQEVALSRMNANIAIFEVKSDQTHMIGKYLKIAKEVKSHRQDRVILLCERTL